MSYFVSEVLHLDSAGDVSRFWQRLFEDSKPGALFLYIDNGSNDFNMYFDNLWATAGLQHVCSETNVRWIPRSSEQSRDLEEYRTKFGQNPKIQAQVSYRMLRKPS